MYGDSLFTMRSVDDLPRGALNFLQVTGVVPAFILISKGIEYYIPWLMGIYDRFMVKGNRYGTPALLFVLAGFLVDDVGTAIGLQAEEVPREALEGNPFMSGAWQFLIDNGVAKTQTDAHRLIAIWLIGVILASQYFGYFNSFSRVLFIALATLKAYAGYSWWGVKPNKYTVIDYLTFKPGRLTNERYSLPLRDEYNVRAGYVPAEAAGLAFAHGLGSTRRRMLRSTTGVNWLTRYLSYIFPAL